MDHKHHDTPSIENSHAIETIETVLEQPTTPAPPMPTPATTAADATAKSSFQVTISLDADTHEHFRSLAAADDRSLNKYLARELRSAYISQR